MSIQIKNHVLNTTFNDKGEMICQDKWQEVSIQNKAKGYRLIYIDDLMEIILRCSSVENVYMLLDILVKMTKKDYSFNYTATQLQKVYKEVSVKTLARLITFMKTNDIIRGSRGKYKVNPYLVIPKFASDEVVAKAQQDWDNDEVSSEIDSYETPMINPDEADYYEPDEVDE